MANTTLTTTALSILIGVVAALVTLGVARARTWPRVLLALVAGGATAGATAFASLFVLVPRGLDEWGFVHLVYLMVTISVPIVGIALVGLGLRGRNAVAPLVVGCLLVVPALLGAYASHVEPRWIRTDEVTLDVAADRNGSDPVRLGILADLQTNHIGAYENEAVDRLLATRPDVILIPGDLFQGNHEEFVRELEPLRALLSRLEAPQGVFFVQGDSDQWWRMQQILPGTGITPLFNEIADVEVGDRHLRIGGTTITYDSGRAQEMVRTLDQEPEDGSIRIVMSHRPDVVDTLPEDSRIDLVVAGHTHGGQIVLPFVGPPVTLSEVPADVARGGLHEEDGTEIVVSPGVGLVRGQAPQVRFLSRPAIVAVDLR